MRLALIIFFRRALSPVILALVISAFIPVDLSAGVTGKQDFEENCAACHGKDGRGHGGKGVYFLPGTKTPDLTILTRSNGGIFPAKQVYESIDGRGGIPSHSRFDMPFWGTDFQQEGKEFTSESEAQAKERISNIVSYIESIQVK
jgi:mono/diheme cytochrome c family protein